MSRRAPRCADCPGAPIGVSTVYGLPSPERIEAAERGEVILGGCVMFEGPMSRWTCPRCGRPLGWGESHPTLSAQTPRPPAPGSLRVGTWNLEKCPHPGHAKGSEVALWQDHLGADIWLLTEVHRDWDSSSGWVAVSPPRGGTCSDTRRWAAIQTQLPMEVLDDRGGAQAAEESLCLARIHLPERLGAGSLLVACSVLPWRGAGRSWSGLPANDLNEQQEFVLDHHVARIAEAWDGEEPIVWGGDFNQELMALTKERAAAGYGLAGTAAGIERLRAAFGRLGLRPLTEHSEHLHSESPTIDHLAVSERFAGGDATVHRPHYGDGTLLSDHAAYIADICVWRPADTLAESAVGAASA